MKDFRQGSFDPRIFSLFMEAIPQRKSQLSKSIELRVSSEVYLEILATWKYHVPSGDF